jgi:glycosyltransferase involved in cell wall biosynthesis
VPNKKPLISVIVTTKNEANNIGRLLDSIKKQTYPNIEIIIVDNNSNDKTKEISKEHTKLVFNFGPERSAQRNYGVGKAKGDYVVILDADMELSDRVIEDCVNTAVKEHLKVLVIPEKTVGEGIISRIRQFEREMYMGDLSIEVARFFDRKVFEEFGGYDLNLTGPEDYDLPYRISKKYKIGRSHEYLYHHEASLSLIKLLKKKYYYASQGAIYAQKHPELVKTQGNLLFRKAYLKHWDHFLKHPLIALSFIIVRVLETIWAIAGFIKAVGIVEFIKTSLTMLMR